MVGKPGLIVCVLSFYCFGAIDLHEIPNADAIDGWRDETRLFICTFESGSLCNMTQDSDDDADWDVNQSGTSNDSAKPAIDHTTGSITGSYVSTRSVSNFLGKSSVLTLPLLRHSDSDKCLTLYYNMDVNQAGRLSVQIKNETRTMELWTRQGTGVIVASNKKLCVFPFTYRGRSFTSCIKKRTGQGRVCATNATFSEDDSGDCPGKTLTGWTRVDIKLPPGDYQTQIKGTTPETFSTAYTAVSIDDVIVSLGSCGVGKVGSMAGTTQRGPLAGSVNGLVVPVVKCDFETSLCSLRQDGNDDFDWTRQKGETSSPDTGPTTDHTLGSANGYYVYIETSLPRQRGDRARLLTPKLELSSNGGCLSFFYHIFGKTTGEFNVYYRYSGFDSLLYTVKGPSDDIWRKATLSLPRGRYELVFEGVVNNVYGDIALDDLHVLPTSCSGSPVTEVATSLYGCSFEGGTLCNITQEQSDDSDWDLNVATSDLSTARPPRDHTRKLTTGSYLSTRSIANFLGRDSVLILPLLARTDSTRCLRLYYNMDKDQSGTLTVAKTGSTRLEMLWSTSGSGIITATNGESCVFPFDYEGNSYITCVKRSFGETSWCSTESTASILTQATCPGRSLTGWTPADIDLPPGDFNVVIIGTTPYQFYTEFTQISIDDVTVTLGSCSKRPPTIPPTKYTVRPTTTLTTEAFTKTPTTIATSLNQTTTAKDLTPWITEYQFCDFQKSFCYFEQDKNDEFDWTRKKGSTPSSTTGPSVDHTTQSSSGYYVYIEASSPRKKEDRARLVTPLISFPNGGCLQFFYHIYGSTIGELIVFYREQGFDTRIFNVSGPSEDSWKAANISLPSGTYSLVFEGVIESAYGDIALDDISITDKTCFGDVPTKVPRLLFGCTFEDKSLCGITQNQNDDFEWTLNRGFYTSSSARPLTDHTTRSAAGFFLKTPAISKKLDQRGDLFLPKLSQSSEEKCLRFFYNVDKVQVGSLSVSVRENGIVKSQWKYSGPGVLIASNGKACVFPFLHQGQSYTRCIKYFFRSEYWCATSPQYSSLSQADCPRRKITGWTLAEVDLPAGDYDVIISGETPRQFSTPFNDISLDDIRVTIGRCYPLMTTASTYKPTTEGHTTRTMSTKRLPTTASSTKASSSAITASEKTTTTKYNTTPTSSTKSTSNAPISSTDANIPSTTTFRRSTAVTSSSAVPVSTSRVTWPLTSVGTGSTKQEKSSSKSITPASASTTSTVRTTPVTNDLVSTRIAQSTSVAIPSLITPSTQKPLTGVTTLSANNVDLGEQSQQSQDLMPVIAGGAAGAGGLIVAVVVVVLVMRKRNSMKADDRETLAQRNMENSIDMNKELVFENKMYDSLA